MGRDEWELAHEYQTEEQHAQDDHEHLIDMMSRIILVLAAVGLITLLPWALSGLLLLIKVVLGLIGLALGFVMGFAGFVLGLIGAAIGLVFGLLGLLLGFLTSPPGLMILLVVLWFRFRQP